MLWYDFLRFDHISGFEDGVTSLGLRQDIGKFIMRSQHYRIYIPVSGALTMGQSQATPYHLLAQDLGCRCSERDDSIKIVDIPPLFEHVDMDHDFNGIVRALHIQQQPHIFLRLRTFLLGVNDEGFIAVRAASEGIRFHKLFHLSCVMRVFADHQHEWLDRPHRLFRSTVVGCIELQLPLGIFVAGNSIRQHQLIQLLIAKIVKVDICPRYSKGSSCITILDRFGERILVHYILEGNLL